MGNENIDEFRRNEVLLSQIKELVEQYMEVAAPLENEDLRDLKVDFADAVLNAVAFRKNEADKVMVVTVSFETSNAKHYDYLYRGHVFPSRGDVMYVWSKFQHVRVPVYVLSARVVKASDLDPNIEYSEIFDED